MAIDFQDNFIVLNKCNLTGEDISSLTQLYLPLFGVDSFALYLTLVSLPLKEENTFKKLLDILCLPKISILEHTIQKLEALGLVKTYQNSSNKYAFEIIAPLCFSDFFSSCLLCEYLVGQIGTVEFEKLKKNHNNDVVKGYKEITKSFDEVFQTSSNNINSLYSTIFTLKKSNPITIKEIDFDYIFFKMLFDNDFINEDLLDDANFKKNILETAHTYHLSEEEMKDVIVTTINIDKELTFDYISKNARNVYRNKSNSEIVKLETKDEDTFISSSLDDKTYKILSYCENTSFADVLQSLSKITPSQSELKMFEELKKNTKLSNGVINFMILQVSNTLNGEIPSYNYFEKIANTWRRAGVKTVIDASNYVLKSKENNKSKGTYKKNEAKKPEWYDEYLNEVESKKAQTKELSEEEVNKILSEANKFFKEGK